MTFSYDMTYKKWSIPDKLCLNRTNSATTTDWLSKPTCQYYLCCFRCFHSFCLLVGGVYKSWCPAVCVHVSEFFNPPPPPPPHPLFRGGAAPPHAPPGGGGGRYIVRSGPTSLVENPGRSTSSTAPHHPSHSSSVIAQVKQIPSVRTKNITLWLVKSAKVTKIRKCVII